MQYLRKSLSLVLLSALLTTIALAAFQEPDTGLIDQVPKDVSVWELANKAFSWFFAFVIVIAVFVIISAGYGYITAGGDAAKTKSSLNKILFSAIGIVIAILAKVVIYNVCNFVVGSGKCGFINF